MIIYLITRLDLITGVSQVLAPIFGIILLFFSMLYAAQKDENTDDQNKLYTLIIKINIVSIIVFTLLAIFVPSTEEMEIITGYKIHNDR